LIITLPRRLPPHADTYYAAIAAALRFRYDADAINMPLMMMPHYITAADFRRHYFL